MKIELIPFDYDDAYRGLTVNIDGWPRHDFTTGDFALDLRNALHTLAANGVKLAPQTVTLEAMPNAQAHH